jgi:hypothetical protein
MALIAALLYYDKDQYWSDPEENEHMQGYGDFADAGRAAGVFQGGQALAPPDSARTLTVERGRGGRVTVTDGAFAETKEVLGGLILLEVDDIDDAVPWAAQIPAAWRGRIELRPVAVNANPTSA